MKVTVKKQEEATGKITYPFIGICNGTVVLFTDRDMGTCLYDEHLEVGRHSATWQQEYFKPLKGTIELSND